MAQTGKAATQQRILDGAVELFGRRGYERTSITQVAAKAGVSRSAVFWHFGDKAGLFREACKHVTVPLRQVLEEQLSGIPPRKRLLELLSLYEDFVNLNRARVQTFVRWMLESPAEVETLRQELLGLHEAFRRQIEVALHELVGEHEDAADLAGGLVALLDGNLLLGLLDGTNRDDEARRRGLRAVVGSILREAGEP